MDVIKNSQVLISVAWGLVAIMMEIESRLTETFDGLCIVSCLNTSGVGIDS